MPKFYTNYNRPPVLLKEPVGLSMTSQEAIEETKIENVVRRCIVDTRTPMYGDFTGVPATLDEALKVLENGKRIREELNKQIKEKEKQNESKSNESSGNSQPPIASANEKKEGEIK